MNTYFKCVAYLAVSFTCLISLFGCGATVVDIVGAPFGIQSMSDQEIRRIQQDPSRMTEQQELERKMKTRNDIETQNKEDTESRDKVLNEKINRQLQGQAENK